MLTPRENPLYPLPGGSEEGGTREAASGRTESPTYYRLSYSGPYTGLKSLSNTRPRSHVSLAVIYVTTAGMHV